MGPDNNTCAITGANGYVGSRITGYFQRQGWIVYELRHRVEGMSNGNALITRYSLENEITPKIFEGVNVLVHCAYDFRATDWESIRNVNVSGSLKLFRAAKAAGVKRIVFISTISAFEGCRSLYGKAKLEIEKEGLKLGATVIRPGLVFGTDAGGMMGTLSNVIGRSKVVPLIGHGDQVLYLVHEEDLCRVILKASTEPVARAHQPIIAACEMGKTLKQIFELLAAPRGKKLTFVPLPWRLIWWLLRSSESIGFRTGFRSDSLVSLLNQDKNPSFEATRQTGVDFREFNSNALALSR